MEPQHTVRTNVRWQLYGEQKKKKKTAVRLELQASSDLLPHF